MHLFKMSSFLLLVFSQIILCTKSPVTVQNKPGIIPDITIQSGTRVYWFRDSLLEHTIYPSVVHCTPGMPCGFFSMGPWDYTCTVFPDTLWGIVDHDLFPSETLFCHSDSAWVLHDTTVYDLANYFTRQSNAICSESAQSYTQNGLCYKFSTGETKVRIRNSCFDTTFTSTFNLPKMPLDSQNGIWFETIDTFFCSTSFIDNYAGCVTRQDIKGWSQKK